MERPMIEIGFIIENVMGFLETTSHLEVKI